MKIAIKDLVDFFNITTEDKDGYCCTSGEKNYLDWEREIAKPAMEARGYTNIHFVTTDGDSFGPLVRNAVCRNAEGEMVRFYYG